MQTPFEKQARFYIFVPFAAGRTALYASEDQVKLEPPRG
jgi:hypothetical protein